MIMIFSVIVSKHEPESLSVITSLIYTFFVYEKNNENYH
jgi:hypothetical protein